MNKLNDKGQRHGYWETNYYKTNYYNGERHGKYECFNDRLKRQLNYGGYYDMGKTIGLWVQYNYSDELTFKVFYL